MNPNLDDDENKEKAGSSSEQSFASSSSSSASTSYAISSRIFIHLIGLVYLVAFLSLSTQIELLYGSKGLLPAGDIFQTVGIGIENNGALDWSGTMGSFLAHPTLFWFSSSDNALLGVTAAGSLLSLLVIAGIFQAPALFLLWTLYLSIVNIGRVFLSFQWDALLLEAGLVAIILAISQNRLQSSFREQASPAEKSAIFGYIDDAGIWLLRWLLFRLMFMSGLVKLLSGDPSWSSMEAMRFHYETQPLPTPLAYFAHQLPEWFQTFSTAGTLIIELLVPFLIYGSKRARRAAASIFILFQSLIILTGNYCFFNWLTIILCLCLIDDKVYLELSESLKRKKLFLPRFFSRIKSWIFEPGRLVDTNSKGRRLFMALAASLLIADSTLKFALGLGLIPLEATRFTHLFAPYHLTSSYGLFAVMTVDRPEIIIEGSMDGKVWKEYVLKYKPGPLDRPPPVVAPHQPRVDWQLWFAAMDKAYHQEWFLAFMDCLANDSPLLDQVFETKPFSRPRFLRANLYDYRFTSIEELARTGNWWKRQYRGVYLPETEIAI